MRDGESPDSMLDCISENLCEAIEQLAPEKTVRPKKKRSPWIDMELQLLIDKYNKLRRCCGRKKGSDILLTELNKVCNKTETKTGSATNAYLQARIGDALNNKNNKWKELSHLGLLLGTEDALRASSRRLVLVALRSGQLALGMWNWQLNTSPYRLVARMAFP